jgi:hypothetical protein
MNEIRAMTEEMKQPVQVKIEMTEDHWVWVFHHHDEPPKLIDENGKDFTVEFSTRAEFLRHKERWCDLVAFEEVSIPE